MIKAAGILILNNEGQALFLKRGAGGDMPGLWCAPGGRIEEGETPEEAACRETQEEAGFKVVPKQLTYWTRQISMAQSAAPAPTTAVPSDATPIAAPIAGDQVDFTTFILKGIETFIPTLCPEHVAYAWAPLDNPPEPLHPGMRISLQRDTMDELHVAEAIRDGQLTSPQTYENVTLFALRITGTDLSYRAKHKEYVWRDKALYLNPRFLARCNGLPVIWEHPEGNTLTSSEYNKRNIGSILLPYQNGDEIWGVAKIYDAGAIKLMSENQLSTSPAVVWRGADANEKVSLENGDSLLIEDTPHLLDHLAICERGVWDKGGPATGILSANIIEEVDMLKRLDNETDDAYKARCDSDPSTQILAGLKGLTDVVKGLASRVDSMEEEKKEDKKADAKKRSDSFEFSKRKDGEDDKSFKERHDAEEEEHRKDMMEAGEPAESAVDKAKKRRKDAEEEKEEKTDKKADEEEDKEKKAKADAEEEEKKKEAAADKARKDSELETKLADLRKEFEDKLKPRNEADVAAMTAHQARFDEVYSAFGLSAPRFQSGETELAYRRRLAQPLQQHSRMFKDADLIVAAVDDNVWTGIETEILGSAKVVAMSPASVPSGQLREIVRHDGGHKITTFVGDINSWLNDFKPTGLAVEKLNRNNANQGSN